jgi:hypothetical protein
MQAGDGRTAPEDTGSLRGTTVKQQNWGEARRSSKVTPALATLTMARNVRTANSTREHVEILKRPTDV